MFGLIRDYVLQIEFFLRNLKIKTCKTCVIMDAQKESYESPCTGLIVLDFQTIVCQSQTERTEDDSKEISW